MADEVLVTEFRLKDQYSQQVRHMSSATKSFLGTLGGVGSAVTNFGLTAAKAFGGASLAVVGFLGAAGNSAAEFDAQVQGLEAYAGSAENLAFQLSRLKEAAKLPGLGFQEAIIGATRLQAAGLSFETAEKALRGFGNALALVGGGRDDLNGVLLALTQIASKSTVSAEEINQIAERVPQIRQIMQSAFGTSNTEDLAKRGITSQDFIAGVLGPLQQLPKAADSAKNTFENLRSSIEQAFVGIGRAANTYLVPAAQQLGKLIEFANDSGLTGDIGAGITKAFTGQSGAPSADAFIRPFAMVAARLTLLGDYMNLFRAAFLIGIESWKIGVDSLVIGLKMVANRLDFFRRNQVEEVGIFTNSYADFVKKGAFNAANTIMLDQAFQDTNQKASEKEQQIVDSFMAAGQQAQTDGAFGDGGKKDPASPINQVATNTGKMVELQKQQLDLSRQILGGGTVASEAASPVRIGQALGRGGQGSRVEQKLREFVREVYNETIGISLASQRNTGQPNRFATR
jgi:tape measure domain-containing protein